ncbi:hypothetical protein PPYR_11907 [Photinus pyralis]|uniref:Uncharacterized protein n=2 Tax=Photinus pyralis TaxID=7054 RepID=A0A5N4ACU1_PHOPY|nr:hypothetical protein PPYR_11907 [Photinus pyralis]
MDKKLLDITNKESVDRERLNKFIAVSGRISELKKKTNENDIQITLNEKECDVLKEECNKLRIEKDLQKQLMQVFKSKVTAGAQLLKKEETTLEEIQNNACKNLTQYIQNAQHSVQLEDLSEVDEHIKMMNVLTEIDEVKKQMLTLKGEVKGLNLFIKCQENQMKTLEDIASFLKTMETRT